MPLEFFVSDDPHLWPVTFSRCPDMQGDAEVAFAAVCSAARDEAKTLILPGDLFDHGEGGGVAYALQLFHKHAKGIEVAYITGNHDATGCIGAFKNPNWLESVLFGRHLTPKPVTNLVLGLKIAGCDYDRDPEVRKKQLTKALAAEPHVLVLHGALDRLLAISPDYAVEDIDGHVPCCLIGDIHVPVAFRGDKGTLFVSTGSLVRRRRSEMICNGEPLALSGSVGYARISSDDGTRFEATLIPVPEDAQRDYVLFPCNDDGDVVRLAEYLRPIVARGTTKRDPRLAKPLVYVDYGDGVNVRGILEREGILESIHLRARLASVEMTSEEDIAVPETDDRLHDLIEGYVLRDRPDYQNHLRSLLGDALVRRHAPGAVLSTHADKLLSGEFDVDLGIDMTGKAIACESKS